MTGIAWLWSALRQHIADPAYFADRYRERVRCWWLEQQSKSRKDKLVVWPTAVRLAMDLATTPGGSAMLLVGTGCTLGTILSGPGLHGFWVGLIFCASAVIANNSLLVLILSVYGKSRWRIFDPFLIMYSLYLLLIFLSFKHGDPKMPIGGPIVALAVDFVRGWRRHLLRTLRQGRDH